MVKCYHCGSTNVRQTKDFSQSLVLICNACGKRYNIAQHLAIMKIMVKN